ncbi:MAG: tRNA lysidine(34) synthetase TilS [Bacteroidetes bacterium]|nr:tRNA lysidine(34) synthetase TilS [Bacteroidota bacterium]
MINLFREYIDQNNLIQPNDEVLLAISGGIDSVVMLDLFDKIGVKYAIAHYNFKLRGDESDDDEKFVRQLAKSYGVEVFVDNGDAKEYSKKNGLSIQEAARDLRYAWFNKVCKENNYSIIAVAHNDDDKIETFFINLFRGAGVKGLKSIPVKRQNIIRPLMFTTREQIEKYAKEHNLLFREDSSNKSDDYLRNKIRHHLIPVIEEISPGFDEAINKSIDNLNDSDILMQFIINEKKRQLFSSNSQETIKVNLKGLLKLTPLRVWMYYLLTEFGFTRKITDAVCYSLENENSTGHKFSSFKYELLIDRDYLIIRKITEKFSSKKYAISNEQSKVIEPINLIIERHKNSHEFVFSNKNNVAYFDSEKLTFPLFLRKWKYGDKMVPFGMKGSKLISDILIDNKVDLFVKEDTYVVISAGKILWLVGIRSSNEFRITKSTKKILKMELC